MLALTPKSKLYSTIAAVLARFMETRSCHVFRYRMLGSNSCSGPLLGRSDCRLISVSARALALPAITRCPQAQVIRRKTIARTHADTRRGCREAFLGLSKTCHQLGPSFWDYLVADSWPLMPAPSRTRGSGESLLPQSDGSAFCRATQKLIYSTRFPADDTLLCCSHQGEQGNRHP